MMRSSSNDQLLVLTADGNIIIYEPKLTKLALKQSLQLINPSTIDAICYQLHCYLAVTSSRDENSVHTGFVEIYRSFNGSDFTAMQTINIRLPKEVKFTVLEVTNDILLFVLTQNPTQSVGIYQYSGVAGFKEFATSSTTPRGNSISVVKLPSAKEYLAVIASQEVAFIEPVMNDL